MFSLIKNIVFAIGKHRFPAEKTSFSTVENAFPYDFLFWATIILFFPHSPCDSISGGSKVADGGSKFCYLPPLKP